ncbi:unnamed protein product [Alternaria alternata]
MKEELERIAKAGGRSKLEPAPGEVEPKDPLAMLKRMSLQDLSAYVSGRQISTIGKPLQFEVMEQSMRKNFSRIRLRCEALLAERVDHLARELKDLTDRLDSNTVFEMAGALQLSDYHTEDAVQSLKQYRELLEQNPKVVRKVEEWYKIKKLISRRGSGRVEALSEALLGIIGLQEQPVFVVIDRPELSEADPASEFAETILRMVEQTDGVLKALIIHRAEFWDWEQNKSLILRKGTPASACQALRLDQRRL